MLKNIKNQMVQVENLKKAKELEVEKIKELLKLTKEELDLLNQQSSILKQKYSIMGEEDALSEKETAADLPEATVIYPSDFEDFLDMFRKIVTSSGWKNSFFSSNDHIYVAESDIWAKVECSFIPKELKMKHLKFDECGHIGVDREKNDVSASEKDWLDDQFDTKLNGLHRQLRGKFSKLEDYTLEESGSTITYVIKGVKNVYHCSVIEKAMDMLGRDSIGRIYYSSGEHVNSLMFDGDGCKVRVF